MEYFIGFAVGIVVGAGIALLAGLIYNRTGGRQMQQPLIDQAVVAVNDRLTRINAYLQNLEAERKKEFGSLGTSIATLSQTTGQLHEVLASTQRARRLGRAYGRRYPPRGRNDRRRKLRQAVIRAGCFGKA